MDGATIDDGCMMLKGKGKEKGRGKERIDELNLPSSCPKY